MITETSDTPISNKHFRTTKGSYLIDDYELCCDLERQRDKAVRLLRGMLDRVDRNGGLGKYKGGAPFVTKDTRAFLARLDKEKT